MSNQSEPRVAVIGGGVIGVSSAYHLARSGAKVCLVTEGSLASGASGRSLSWLNSAAIRSEHYHRLRMVGIDRYRALFAHHPNQDWLRFDGGLNWQSYDEAESVSKIHAHQLAQGYDSHLLTPDEVEVRIPGVDPAAIPALGAIWNPGEGWVDLPSLINHLSEDLVGRGGELITNAGEATVTTSGGRVSGVMTERHGVIEVDAVLLATGAKTPSMVAQFGVTIPDATTRALLVRTRPVQTQLRAVLNTPRVSVRPTPDGGLAVDSDWTEPHIEVRGDGTSLGFRPRLSSSCSPSVPRARGQPASHSGQPGHRPQADSRRRRTCARPARRHQRASYRIHPQRGHLGTHSGRAARATDHQRSAAPLAQALQPSPIQLNPKAGAGSDVDLGQQGTANSRLGGRCRAQRIQPEQCRTDHRRVINNPDVRP